MTAEPSPMTRGRRTLLLAAGAGLALLAVGVYLVVMGWPTGASYPQDGWFAYGPEDMVGISVAGPSAGFVVGFVLVALGAGVLGAALGWGLSGRAGDGQALVALWRAHRVLVVVASGGALLLALGALLFANAASTADDGSSMVVVAGLQSVPWTDVQDMAARDAWEGSWDEPDPSGVTPVSEIDGARFTTNEPETTLERVGAAGERAVGLLIGGAGLLLLGGVGGWLLAPARRR